MTGYMFLQMQTFGFRSDKIIDEISSQFSTQCNIFCLVGRNFFVAPRSYIKSFQLRKSIVGARYYMNQIHKRFIETFVQEKDLFTF